MTQTPVAELRQAVAAEIRAGMGRHRITQAALAKRLGCGRITISERLAGNRAFSTDQLVVIADVLDINLVDLLAPACVVGGDPSSLSPLVDSLRQTMTECGKDQTRDTGQGADDSEHHAEVHADEASEASA